MFVRSVATAAAVVTAAVAATAAAKGNGGERRKRVFWRARFSTGRADWLNNNAAERESVCKRA